MKNQWAVWTQQSENKEALMGGKLWECLSKIDGAINCIVDKQTRYVTLTNRIAAYKKYKMFAHSSTRHLSNKNVEK